MAENKSVPEIKPIDKQGNYYQFDLKYGGPDSQIPVRKFKNPSIDQIKVDPIFYTGKNLWILKPSGLNRGKGLELFSTLEELNEFLKLYTTGYNVKEFITMQYSDNDNISPSLMKSTSQSKLNKEGNLAISLKLRIRLTILLLK